MAIARIPGYSLISNLDRQGTDLQFTTNGNALVYMDFADFRLGVNTSNPTQTLEVNGNVLVANGHVLTSANLTYDIGSQTNYFRNIYVSNLTSANLGGILQTPDQPNITSLGNLTSLNASGTIQTTGIIYGNSGIGGTILTASQPNITSIGNLTSLSSSGTIETTGIIYGNSGLSGTILTVDQTNITSVGNLTSLNVSGNIITQSNLLPDANVASNLGQGNLWWNALYSNVIYANQLNGTIQTASQPNITNLANISLTNITVGNAITADSANITSITATNISGTIQTADQPNITNLGNITVTSITIGGNINISGNTVGGIIQANAFIQNGYNVLDANTQVVITGEVTGSGNVSNISVTLANSGVTSGVYGSSLGYIPQLAIDSKGRITSAANIAITQIGNLSFNDTTISSSGNIYLNAQSAGIVQISGSDALGLPAGNSISRPASPNLGYIRFNTDDGSLEYWDGNSWTYPGAATITSELINADGVNATYTLSSNSSADGLLVSINGTMQQPFVAYTMSGNEITFIETPQDTDIIEVRKIAAGATSVSSLSYGPETTVQLTVGNINVTGNIIPGANVTYSLGSSDRQWKDLWVSNNTIYIGGTPVTVANGVLTVGGAPVGSTYSDSNVASYLTTYTGNITANSFVGDRFTYSNGVSILDSVISLVTSNAAIQAGLITELTSNAAVQAGLISAAVTAAGETTANANTAMKGYVDGQVSTLTSNAAVQAGLIASLDSNAAVQAGAIADNITAITTANAAMKGYIDAINSTLTANAGAQAGTLATIQSTYAQLSGATFSGALSAPSLALTTALPITSGGTGGTSTSAALNNLLPSGEVSGYVLKTAGEGSYYWSAETGGGSTVGTQISSSRTFYTATSGQTVFAGVGTYTPGASQLRVYINGVRQFDSAYTETNSSAFTLSAGVSSGAIVLAEIDGYTDFNAYANTTYSTPVGSISSTTVQDALAELDTEKAALAGAAFTGNVSTTGNLRVTDTTPSTGEGTGALVVSGGASFGGNVYISGNLQVAGTETIFNANNLNIADSLIYLADDNSGDVLDIGFVGSFTNPGYQHTGFARDASDGTWKLFANVVAEPTTTIDFTHATYSNLRIGNLTSIGGTFTGNVGAGNLSATNLTGTLTTAAQTNVTSLGTLTGLTVSGAPVPNANVSVNLGSTSAWWSTFYANTYVGATATFTGNITAGNLSATNLTGTLLIASQPNITQVGTLANLTVTGNVVAGNLNLNAGLATARMSMITTTDTGQLTFNSSTGFRLIDAGTTVLAVDPEGDLGVGTDNPGYRLHVVGDPNRNRVDAALIATVGKHAEISLRNQGTHYAFWGSDNTSGSAFYANSSANACVFGTTTTNNIQFVTDFTERVRILGSTGNVGINTTNPTATLHVNGNLLVSGLTTLSETTETLDTKSSVTGTVVHDFSTTAIWYYSSISGNVTANITNVPTTNNRITSVSIVVNQGSPGYIVNGLQIDGAAQTIRWQANTVPTASTNRVDVFTFSLLRAANAWTVLGSATSHG